MKRIIHSLLLAVVIMLPLGLAGQNQGFKLPGKKQSTTKTAPKTKTGGKKSSTKSAGSAANSSKSSHNSLQSKQKEQQRQRELKAQRQEQQRQRELEAQRQEQQRQRELEAQRQEQRECCSQPGISGLVGYTAEYWGRPHSKWTGKVNVKVRVDPRGKVIEAHAVSGSGEAWAHPEVRRSCEQAARESAFSVPKNRTSEGIGTITWRFIE